MLLVSGCSGNNDRDEASRPVPVRVSLVASRNVQQTLDVIGHVEASSTVRVAAQVSGQLMQSLVGPGNYVSEGQLLFRLDPRTFEAGMHQAAAALERDEALLQRARQDMERYRVLAARDYLSQQQYDQSRTDVASLEATITQDKAALEYTRLQLGYTDIAAPIGGRVGEILVDPGNIVKANDTELLVINTISPAEVSFSVAEKYLPELNRRMRNGDVEIRVQPQGDAGKPVAGRLSVIDNTVDRETGSIAMRAVFANKDERLWPGQFVRVYIVMESVPDAVVMPFSAALEGVNGQYVYVLQSDNTVVVRQVRTTQLDDGTLLVESGLRAGERVVTDGQVNLFPGASVEIVESAPGAPEAPENGSGTGEEAPGGATETMGTTGITGAKSGMEPASTAQSADPAGASLPQKAGAGHNDAGLEPYGNAGGSLVQSAPGVDDDSMNGGAAR